MNRRLGMDGGAKLAVALCVSMGVVQLTTTAAEAGVGFAIEPGVSIPLAAPQSNIYDVGGGQSLKLLIGLTPWLDLGGTASFMLLPPSAPNAESGVAWGYGGGLRLKRPHDAESFAGIAPWVDVDALYVRTGHLDRPGFDAAVGLAIPITRSRAYWVGPFVRYFQTFQPDRAGYDDTDAKILTLGLSFEVGRALDRERVITEALAPAAGAQTVATQAGACSDRDRDGLPDAVDRCPDAVGPIDNWGCPKYEKVVVQPDKLELREVITFAWDQATLDADSLPVLDEVVKALKDNPGFRVQVQGHADASGKDDHNQTLSDQRAQAVVDYLVSHGIPKERVSGKGFSSSVPTDSDKTVEGREHNRRVEFVVSFVIVEPGAAQ